METSTVDTMNGWLYSDALTPIKCVYNWACVGPLINPTHFELEIVTLLTKLYIQKGYIFMQCKNRIRSTMGSYRPAPSSRSKSTMSFLPWKPQSARRVMLYNAPFLSVTRHTFSSVEGPLLSFFTSLIARPSLEISPSSIACYGGDSLQYFVT